MSNPVTDLTWENLVLSLPDGKLPYGGARWYSNFYAMGITNEFVDTKWISASCAAFDETVNVDENHPFEIEVATFNNGVKLVICLWYQIVAGTDAAVIGKTKYKYNNTYVDTPYASIGGYVSAGPALATPAAIKAYGIKYALLTNYTGPSVQDAGGVLTGVTTAKNVSLTVILPYQQGSLLQSWITVHDGRMIMQWREDPQAAYTQPDGFYYPQGLSQFVSETLQYTDLDDLIADIAALNPAGPTPTLPETGTPAPTQEDDPSGEGGGDGNPDITSDPIPFPDLPTGGAIATGSIKSFLVDTTRVQAVFRRLWNSNLFDVLTWQKIIEEPLDSLISLVCIPAIPTNSGSGSIQLGNIDTEVLAPIVTSQYLTIDCGKVTVPKYWGSAMDYSPYTKVDCYLPFIKTVPLKPEDVMGKELHIKYNMDILTGNLSANIMCGPSVLYKFQGNAKATVPITARIFSALEAIMKGAGSAAAAYATGAMQAATNPEASSEHISQVASAQAGGAAISAAVNVAMSKVQITRSGDLSGSVGLLDDFTPHLIIHRPKQSLPDQFKAQKGYPSNITNQLGRLKGYTEVEYIHLTGIDGATDTELAEIEALLKSGVII